MSRVSRRGALKVLGAAAAVSALPVRGADAQPAFGADALMPLAEVVLPSELGADGRHKAVDAFVRWIRDYKEGADTDHGYGNTRIRSLGPSPAAAYPAQLAALDAAAFDHDATTFASASLAVRREIVEAAIAYAKVERLPGRPNGGHVATDLMGHFFASAEGSNLCYRAAIDRDSCRGLPGSEERPAPLTGRR